MQKHVFRYEMKLLLRDGVAGITAVLFFGAMMYAGWLGVRYTNEMHVERVKYQQSYAEHIAEMKEEAEERERVMIQDSVSLDTYTWGPRNPYSVGSSTGYVVTVPPAPLAAFTIGQSDLQPVALKVTVAGVRAAGSSATLENPFKLLVGHFDLSFVYLYIFPLLIIGITYGLTSAERESGLLRMVMAQPIRLTSVVRGKIGVRVVLLGSCMVLGSGVIGVLAGVDVAFQRWLLWLLAAFIYGAFWVGLCVFVDSRVQAASTGALVLAGCWLAVAVVIPALVSFFATVLYPVPSRMEYITAMRTESSLAQQQGAASLARFFEDHPEIAPVSDDDANFAMLRVAREERIAEQLAPLEARYNEQQAKQKALIDKIGYLSPTVLTHQAFMDIAGTGSIQFVRFQEEAYAFQEAWKAHFVPRYFADVAFRAADYDGLPIWQSGPVFDKGLTGRIGPLLGCILLYSVLLFYFGFVKYRRQDLVHS